MLLKHCALALLAVSPGLCQAASHYCPPFGPVLPAPKRPGNHPAVRSTVEVVIASLKEQVAGFNNSAVSIGFQSIYDDEPLLDFHHTPSNLDPKHGVREVNANTVYRIGSISKLFTVLATLRLAEDGVVSMSDPVGRWIPELLSTSYDHGDAEEGGIDHVKWEDITLEALATHMAGIGSGMSNELAAYERNWTALGLPELSPTTNDGYCGAGEYDPCTRQDILRAFTHKRPPVYPSFQSPVYSNPGTGILGLVVEAATNKTFEAALQYLVLQPLGLGHTTVGKKLNQTENMFIPIGSVDWNMDLGVFDPAGGLNTNTKDLLSFATSILRYEALSPAATRRWLKPVTFTSAWSSSVGAPWEIYRLDNLTTDGRVVDFYTKGGALGSYSSALVLAPDLGFAITILAAGPEAAGLWTQLAAFKAIRALTPAMDLASKAESEVNFAGTYTHEETGSRLTISLDHGPGLVLSDWVVRGFEVLPNLNRYNPMAINDTKPSDLKEVRLYPTGVAKGPRSAWRAVFPPFTNEVAEIIDESTGVRGASCITWQHMDLMLYNWLSLDHFEFLMDEDGESALSLKSRGFDIELKRAKLPSSGEVPKKQ